MVISGTVIKHKLPSGGVPLVNTVTAFIGLPLLGVTRTITEMNYFIAYAVHYKPKMGFYREKLEKSWKNFTHSIDIIAESILSNIQ